MKSISRRSPRQVVGDAAVCTPTQQPSLSHLFLTFGTVLVLLVTVLWQGMPCAFGPVHIWHPRQGGNPCWVKAATAAKLFVPEGIVLCRETVLCCAIVLPMFIFLYVYVMLGMNRVRIGKTNTTQHVQMNSLKLQER